MFMKRLPKLNRNTGTMEGCSGILGEADPSLLPNILLFRAWDLPTRGRVHLTAGLVPAAASHRIRRRLERQRFGDLEITATHAGGLRAEGRLLRRLAERGQAGG